MTTLVLDRAARRIVLTVVCLGLLGATSASSAEELGWFVGIAHDDTDVEVARGQVWEYAPGSTGFALQGGYRFAKHGAVGFGYRQATDLHWIEQAYFAGPGAFTRTETDFDSRALQGSVIGIWTPGGGIFEIYAKAGLTFYSLDGDQVLTSRSGDESVALDVSDSGSNYLVGFGFGLSLTPAWHLSLGYEYFEFDGDFLGVGPPWSGRASLDSVAFGLQYRFAGRRSTR